MSYLGHLKYKFLEKKSHCVQFVIVLQRDRKLGRANELNGYEKSKAGNLLVHLHLHKS